MTEEGTTPISEPMELGEMANWTPLDGSEGLRRKRAENQDMMCCGDSMQFHEDYFYCPVCETSIETEEFKQAGDDDYDDYVFCEGCGEERKSVGPDSVFTIDNARGDVLDDGNVLCDRCHTRGYKIERDAESFAAERECNVCDYTDSQGQPHPFCEKCRNHKGSCCRCVGSSDWEEHQREYPEIEYRAESPSDTIPVSEPSWVKPVATALGFGLGFLGIKQLKKEW